MFPYFRHAREQLRQAADTTMGTLKRMKNTLSRPPLPERRRNRDQNNNNINTISNGYSDTVNIQSTDASSSNGSSDQDSGIAGVDNISNHEVVGNEAGKNSMGKCSISTIGQCSITGQSNSGESSSGGTFAEVQNNQMMPDSTRAIPQNVSQSNKVPPPTKTKPALPLGTTIMSLTNKADQRVAQSQPIIQQAVKVLPDLHIQSMMNIPNPNSPSHPIPYPHSPSYPQETSFMHQANQLLGSFKENKRGQSKGNFTGQHQEPGHELQQNRLGHQRSMSQQSNNSRQLWSNARSVGSSDRGPLPSIPDRQSNVYGSLPGRGRYSRHIVASDDNNCTLTRYRRHSGSG